MRRGIGVFAALAAIAATVVVFAAPASAGQRDPVPGWLTPVTCVESITFDLTFAAVPTGPHIVDDLWEDGWVYDCFSDVSPVAMCVDGTDYTVWFDNEDEAPEMVEDINRFDHTASLGACANAPEPQGPDRYIYCAAAGNTDANGNPLGVGQTLNLKWGEPAGDKHYAGATLGFWVQGVGLTCQLTPAQAALAAASTVKVNHTGAPNSQEGDPVYTFVPAS